jgi:hypothetical protein
MKKITLLMALLLSVSSYAQYLTEGFEGLSFPPVGWTVVNTNANQNWQSITGLVDANQNPTVTPTEGTQAAAVLFDLNAQNESLTSPVIDLTGATNPQLVFDANISYFWAVSPNDNFDVTVSVLQGLTSTPIWTETDLGVFNGQQWYEIVLDLTPYVNSSIRLEFNYNGADGDYLVIDDIKVEEAPACPVPNSLELTSFTSTTADISWTNTGDFDIEWGEFPYTQGTANGNTGQVTAGNSFQLTSLTPGVSYNVFVRQNCGVAGTSSYETIIVGTLPDSTITFPFAEDLEPDTNQALLLNLGVSFFTNTNNWQFGQDDLTDGDITNDVASDGISFFFSNNTFTTTDADATIYFGPYTLTAGNQYTFGFDQRNRAVSDATLPNKDIEIIAATSNDGANNTVLATFDDMDNITYQSRNGSFTPSTSGEYYFGIRDKSNFLPGVMFGNSVFIDALTITSTLSVDEFSTNELVHFFDSRTSSLNIQSSVDNIDNIQVYNLLGQQVADLKIEATSAIIPMNNYKDGLYVIKANQGNTSQSFKFIKK